MTIVAPVVDVAEEQAGVVPELVGVLGGGFLRQYRVIIDYARARLVLEECAEAVKGMDHDNVDRSGLVLVANGENREIVVYSVIPGLPGHRAEITKGDVLVTCGDKSAEELGLGGCRARLRKQGTDIVVRVRRGNDLVERTLRLDFEVR